MKAILRFLMRHDLRWPVIWAGPLVLWAVSMLLAFTAFGYFTTSGIDERQNRDFAEAIDAQPPPTPIAAAFEAGGAPFAQAMRDELKKASNGVRQARSLQLNFAKTRPAEAKQAEWSDTYVCGLPAAWGDHRALMRTLVLKGYGECDDNATFVAGSPVLYWNSGWPGYLIIWFLAVAAGLLSLGLIALYFIRGAYRWLYSSSVV